MTNAVLLYYSIIYFWLFVVEKKKERKTIHFYAIYGSFYYVTIISLFFPSPHFMGIYKMNGKYTYSIQTPIFERKSRFKAHKLATNLPHFYFDHIILCFFLYVDVPKLYRIIYIYLFTCSPICTKTAQYRYYIYQNIENILTYLSYIYFC